MGEIAANLSVVRACIQRAAENSGRDAQTVRLVAVTKTVPVGRIREAIEAGLSEFGENRVQEAADKFAPHGMESASAVLDDKVVRDGIVLHLIGSLQRNKARHAAFLFDCVQSVDRVGLVLELSKSRTEQAAGHRLPVLVQVNVTGEASKSGVSPHDLPKIIAAVSSADSLVGAGLMTIARLGAGESELRQTFGVLRSLRDDIRRAHDVGWAELSMGMSDDYEIAIEEGATIIRLGRAIFGARNL